VVIAVLLVVVGTVVTTGPTTTNSTAITTFQHRCYDHAPTVKPEAATAVVEFLMMGVKTPEIC
jgi:hypothetical protein